MGERACRRESPTISEGKPRHDFSPDSEIGTTDSTDFTDFEEVIRNDHINLFMAKLQGRSLIVTYCICVTCVIDG